MPSSLYMKLGLVDAKTTTMLLQLTDRSPKHPRGIIKDVLVKVDKFIYLIDLIILYSNLTIPCMGRALIDVYKRLLVHRLDNEKFNFNVLKAIKYLSEASSCY